MRRKESASRSHTFRVSNALPKKCLDQEKKDRIRLWQGRLQSHPIAQAQPEKVPKRELQAALLLSQISVFGQRSSRESKPPILRAARSPSFCLAGRDLGQERPSERKRRRKAEPG